MTDTAGRLDRRGPNRGDQRRTALLRALDHLLWDGNSLDAVTIADVSRRAGVTRSGFYFYFENKAMAVAALMDEFYDEASSFSRLLVSGEGKPPDRIETTVRGLFDSLERRAHVYLAVLDARATSRTVREFWDSDRTSFIEPVADLIDGERAAGHAPDGADAYTLATLLLELNDRALERHARGDGPERESHIGTLVSIWLRSIYGTRSEL